MDVSEDLPPIFIQVRRSLAPYIKSRQEVSHIRQILAAHLNSQLQQQSEASKSGLLSLQDSSADVKVTSKSTRGLQKEYLKCLKANVKARREYDALKTRLMSSRSPGSRVMEDSRKTSTASSQFVDPVEDHVLLIKQRRRLERLRILQHYTGSLAQKPVMSTSFDADATSNVLPRVPVQIIADVDSNNQGSTKADVENLVLNLKRAVLNAKATLKSERHNLDQVQKATSGQQGFDKLSGADRRLYALSQTRNELISWVESELGKAGKEGAEEAADGGLHDTEKTIDSQLETVREQYAQYVQARNDLLAAVSTQVDAGILPSQPEEESSAVLNTTASNTPYILPFLDDILAISNDQKSLIHQRAHLITSLANQYKSTVQIFDRLEDESHLLPAFPLPASHSLGRDYGTSTTFADDMSNKGLARTSDRARAWIYAAEAATTNTKDTVLENVENGSNAIEEARQVILEVDAMLGHEGDPREHSEASQRDVWSLVDGHVGVLRRNDD